MGGWLGCSVAGWVAGRLGVVAGWVAGRLVVRVASWMVGWATGWLAGWLARWLGLLFGCLAALFDWLARCSGCGLWE